MLASARYRSIVGFGVTQRSCKSDVPSSAMHEVSFGMAHSHSLNQNCLFGHQNHTMNAKLSQHQSETQLCNYRVYGCGGWEHDC